MKPRGEGSAVKLGTESFIFGKTKQEDTMDTLGKIQMELKVPKDLWNDFGGYKYRSCESILEAVKPIFPESLATFPSAFKISAISVVVVVLPFVPVIPTIGDSEIK